MIRMPMFCLLLVFCVFAQASLFGAQPGTPAAPRTEDYPRSLAEMKVMLDILQPAAVTLEYTTPPAGFEAGKLSPVVQTAYIRRVQQYRYICQLPYEDLQADDGLANLAQHAALVCDKLGALSHKPPKPKDMPDAVHKICFKGASESNLFMGITDPARCVDGWMDDSDKSNIDRVGHRRWIINPAMLKTGFGAVGRAAAMHSFDVSRKNTPAWDTVAYPCKGFMPVEFFGPQHAWSLSLNRSKFKINPGQIKVTVTPADEQGKASGEPLKIDYFNVDVGGYGSGPCIIFKPAKFELKEAAYRVTVDGLGPPAPAGKAAGLSYLVHFAKLSDVADGPELKTAYTAHMTKRFNQAAGTADPLDRHDALEQFAREPLLAKCDESLGKKAAQMQGDLAKSPSIARELEARKLYEEAKAAEANAGEDAEKLKEAANLYRGLADKHRVTRAGKQAGLDFERLKPKTGLR